jgi:hypothetical protein
MKCLLFIVLLAVLFSAACIGGSNEKNVTSIKTLTPIPNVTVTTLTQQSQIKYSSIRKECIPNRLQSGFHEPVQSGNLGSSACSGTGAPIFSVPIYPAGPIVNDPIVGKFYWWSNLGYCEFRDDGIWILYAWDNQPHYYPGTWIRGGNTSYTTGKIFSYHIGIVRPSAMGSTNYTESLTLEYDPNIDRLYLAYYDGIEYARDFNAWIGRFHN